MIFCLPATFAMFRKPLEDFLKAVDEVTSQDITEISQKLVSSPLTMASYGEGIRNHHEFSALYVGEFFDYLHFLLTPFLQLSMSQPMMQSAACSSQNDSSPHSKSGGGSATNLHFLLQPIWVGVHLQWSLSFLYQ